MDSWGWVVIYALGLTLLQLLVYRYLVNGDKPTIGKGFGRDSARADRYAHPKVAAPLDDGSQVGAQTAPTGERICPNCGAENEADTTFDFCQNCTRRLRRRLAAGSVLSTLA